VEETSKNAQTIFFSLIGLCAFSLLTVATTTDTQLILNNFKLQLPILSAEVPVVLFYIVSTIVGLLVFTYLHLYLDHLWEIIAGLPSVFPDGFELRRKVYPWILNLIIEEWQKPHRQVLSKSKKPSGWSIFHPIQSVRRIFHKYGESSFTTLSPWDSADMWSVFHSIRACIAIFLGWAIVPITIFIIIYRFAVRHDLYLSFVLFGLFSISVLLASIFYERTQAILTGQPLRYHQWKPKPLAVATLVAVFFFIFLGFIGLLPGTTARINLRGVNLERQVFGSVDLSFANLRFAHR
jgi:hypothetical protein